MYCIIKCIVQGNKRVLKTQICVTRSQCVNESSTEIPCKLLYKRNTGVLEGGRAG